MNCKNFQKVIASDLIDGLPEGGSETQKHLESCPVCREYYEALSGQKLSRFRNASPGSPSPETWGRIRHRIFEKQLAAAENRKGLFSRRFLPRWVLALPVLAVIFALTGRVMEPGFKVLPETEFYLIGEVGLSGDTAEMEDVINFGSAAEDFLI